MEKISIFCCECCGNEYDDDDRIIAYTDGNEAFVCLDCANNYYVECEDCGDYHNEKDITNVNGSNICYRCLRYNYSQCECGCYSHIDSVYDGLCVDCHKELEEEGA